MRTRWMIAVPLLVATGCGGGGGSGGGPGTTAAVTGASATVTQTDPSTTVAETGAVEVVRSQWSYSYGSFSIAVLVANHTNHPVTDVRLDVQLVDASGATVAHNDPAAAAVFLPVAVDEVVPASVYISSSEFPGSDTTAADVRVTVTGWGRPTVAYLPVEVDGLRAAPGSTGTNFSGPATDLMFGTLHNPSDTALDVGIVQVYLLGPDGLPQVEPSLISAVFVPHLGAGETLPFRLQGLPPGTGPESVSISVWATAAFGDEPQGRISLESDTTTFRRSDQVVNIVGAFTNTSASPAWVMNSILCVVHDADGAVVDMMYALQEGSNRVSGVGYFGAIPAGATAGFVCSDSQALTAMSDAAVAATTVDVIVDDRSVMDGTALTEWQFTTDPPQFSSGLVTVTVHVTNDTQQAVGSFVAPVVIRGADGRVVGAGLAWYCRQDPTGCSTAVGVGETVALSVAIDVPPGLDPSTTTVDVQAYA